MARKSDRPGYEPLLEPKKPACHCGGQITALYETPDRSIGFWVCNDCSEFITAYRGRYSKQLAAELRKSWLQYFELEFHVDREGSSNG